MRTQDLQSGSCGSKHASKGFSLIELLIVVGIILIIAAIAVPNFMQSKMRANEAAAVASLRNISTAEVVYSTSYGIGYSSALIKLGGILVIPDANNAGLIDDVLARGTKSGYIFTYTVAATDPSGKVVDYNVLADPASPGVTGTRHFYTDTSCVIRQNQSAAAGPSDPPIS